MEASMNAQRRMSAPGARQAQSLSNASMNATRITSGTTVRGSTSVEPKPSFPCRSCARLRCSASTLGVCQGRAKRAPRSGRRSLTDANAGAKTLPRAAKASHGRSSKQESKSKKERGPAVPCGWASGRSRSHGSRALAARGRPDLFRCGGLARLALGSRSLARQARRGGPLAYAPPSPALPRASRASPPHLQPPLTHSLGTSSVKPGFA